MARSPSKNRPIRRGVPWIFPSRAALEAAYDGAVRAMAVHPPIGLDMIAAFVGVGHSEPNGVHAGWIRIPAGTLLPARAGQQQERDIFAQPIAGVGSFVLRHIAYHGCYEATLLLPGPSATEHNLVHAGTTGPVMFEDSESGVRSLNSVVAARGVPAEGHAWNPPTDIEGDGWLPFKYGVAGALVYRRGRAGLWTLWSVHTAAGPKIGVTLNRAPYLDAAGRQPFFETTEAMKAYCERGDGQWP
jgi:hypothetical protein